MDFKFSQATEEEIARKRMLFAGNPGALGVEGGALQFKEEQGSAFWEAFSAGFARENLIGTWLGAFGPDALKERQGDKDEVNPFQWLRENLSPERLAQIDPFVGKGVFDDVKTQYELRRRLAQLEYEIGRSERADRNLFGDIVGSVSGAVIDPTTFVPLVGWGAKGRLALSTLRGASKLYSAGRRGKAVAQRVRAAQQAAKAAHEANIAAAKVLGVSMFTHASRTSAIAGYATTAAVVEGLREIGLHDEQITRTITESLLNIGFAGLLGGGIGAFARVRSKASPLNPSSEDTIVHHLVDDTVNEGVVTRVAGEGEDAIPATAEVPKPRNVAAIRDQVVADLNSGPAGSVGAAAVEETVSGLELAKGLFTRVPGVEGFNKFLRTNAGTGTPMGRFIHATSKPARRVYASLMDRGGTMTQNEIKGIAENFSAEDVQQILHFQTYHMLQASQARMRHALDQKLGEFRAQGKVPANAPKRIADDDWQDVVIHHLITSTDDSGAPIAMWDIAANLQKAMEQRYGKEFTGLVINDAKKFAAETNATRRDMMQQLKDRGLVKDEARIEKLEKDIEAATDQLAALRDQRSAVKKARSAKTKEGDRSSPEGDAQKIAELDDQIKTLEANRKDLSDTLGREKNKVDDLGGEYGTAQLWFTPRIIENQGEFREFLRRLLVDRPPEDWLEGQFGISLADFENLGIWPVKGPDGTISVEDGLELRSQILNDWTGGGRSSRKMMLEDQLQMHKEAMDTAHFELEQLNRDLRMAKAGDKVDWETASSKIGLAEQRLDAAAARLEEARRVLRKHEADAAKLDEAFEGLNLGRTVGEADGTEPFDFASALRGASDEVDEADALADIGANRKRRARVEAKLQKKIDEVAHLENKVSDLNVSIHRAHQLVTQYDEAQNALSDLGETYASVSKRLKRATNDAKRPEIDRAIDNIIENIMSGDTSRMTSHLDEALEGLTTKTPARLKQRSLRLPLEMRKEAIDNGWLRRDLDALLYTEFRQMSGSLGIAEALNLGDKAGQAGTWTDIVREVQDDYNKLIGKAKTAKERGRLERERDLALKDYGILRDRLMGNLDPTTDPNKFMQWTAKRMREVNFMRYVPGFLLASFTDLATVHMVNNGMGSLLRNHATDAFKLLKEMKVQPNEIAHLAASLEVMMTNHFRMSGRMAALGNLDDGYLRGGDEGFGAHGSRTRMTSDKIAKGTGLLAEKINKLSGMPWWNSMWKIMTGLHMSKKVREIAEKGWDNLSKGERSQLAALGLTEDMAEQVANLIKKHSPRKQGGTVSESDIGLDKWAQDGPEAAKAAFQFRMVLNRSMNRAIFTPGIGDTPPFMEKWFMKWLFQFQSYAFTFMNRFMNPMSQKLRNIHDVKNFSTMAVLLLSANAVVWSKAAVNGNDPTDLSLENYLYDVIDRSGFFTYLTPYLDSGLKLTSPVMNELGLDFTGSRSRFSQATWYQTLLGVNFRTFIELGEMGIDLTRNDHQKLAKRLLRWAPLNQWMRFIDNAVHDDKEGITNFGWLD